MIKVNFTEELLQDTEIDGIFERIAKNIYKNNKKIECTFENVEEVKYLKSPKDIKKFLLAKDFYNYKLSEKGKINLGELFKYDRLNFKDKHKLLSKINPRICPYCNMNYILTYFDEGNNIDKSTADIDHFYPKGKNGYYALCLYNFVPSCSMCNSRLKHQIEFDRENYIFPPEESFEGRASFEVTNLMEVIMNNKDSKVEPKLKLTVYNDNDKKVENSIKVFKINEIYKNHTQYAQELLDNAIKYNKSYMEELAKLLDVDIKGMIFGTELSEDDIADVSLGKLKRDLLKQFMVY